MQAAIFIRLALIEAGRGGLGWLAPLCIALGVALGVFLAQLAITESRQLQVAVVAAMLRLSAVLIVATQVVSSIRREVDERRLELLLALPLARATQYMGRLAGFIALGAMLAICFALPLLLWAPPAAVLAWAASLAVELALVAAAALFFAMSLTQLVPALAATTGLYLLARSITAIQAIASGPLAEHSLAHELARGAVNGLAFLLPTLDRATRTEWLLYGSPDSRTFGVTLTGMLVYTALLGIAGLFDFQRRGL